MLKGDTPTLTPIPETQDTEKVRVLQDVPSTGWRCPAPSAGGPLLCVPIENSPTGALLED